MTGKIFSVWEGVFSSFAEAGKDLDVFEGEIWINKQKEKLKEALSNFHNGIAYSRDCPLPLVISMLISNNKSINVLDFGGGVGIQYLELITKSQLAISQVNYTVVDNEKIIKLAERSLKKDFKNLKFAHKLEDISEKMDIVHIGSTLQYIEDWKTLLKTLVQKFKPSYLVFSDLLAGNIPDFVSNQLYYGKKIPHHFIKAETFVNYVSNMQYTLVFKSKFITNILNQSSIFPNTGLPHKYRIDRAINLIFKTVV